MSRAQQFRMNAAFVPSLWCRIGLCWLLLWIVTAAPAREPASAWNTFAAQLATFADEYEKLGYPAEADRLRSDLAAGQESVAIELPRHVVPSLPENASEALHEIWQRERDARAAYTNVVYRKARAAFVDGISSTGLRLLRHALAIDADAALPRQMLGYVRVGEQWKTTYEARMERAGKVWDDRFGWVATTDLSRYEAGERKYRNRWMTVVEETEFRQHFENAWVVETEHFVVKTNVSLETAARIATRLETFRGYFHQEYAKLFDSPRAAREFLKPAARRQRRKHEVHYYASREEYVRRLMPKQPGVAISRGVYLPRDRVSYFFDDPEVEKPLETLYHEVTHQLLFESDPKMREIAASGGYWAVEGFACYLESFHEPEEARREGVLTTGDPDHERMFWARHRVLVEGIYLPIEAFDRLGMRLFQQADEETLRQRYSQSTGLTHFFLHYEDGRYRSGFLEYLAAIYGPSARKKQSLQQRLNVPYEVLDRQYRDHLTQLEAKSRLKAVRHASP